VRFHIQRLKVKLGTNSRTELVVRAVRAGFIVVPEDEAQE
jgi:DNA-binding CsgD family transcriptional regulator